MPPPARATVEEIEDEDDPYAPYQPGSDSSTRSRTSSSSPDSNFSFASTSSPYSGASSSPSGRTSTTSHHSSQNHTTSNDFGQSHTASSIYDQSPSSGNQGSFPREGGDDEPLFGGRPFRDAHDPSSSPANASDPNQARDKEYFYALLNVPKDATQDAIKDSYRSLAIVLHPDKHQDASRKSAAESRFREVQRAYEILSDPEKRTVYDYFGEEGLKSSWSVAVRGRSREAMEREFERERRRKIVEDAEGLVKSKGDFTAHIDATSLFAPASQISRTSLQQRRGPLPTAAVGKGQQATPTTPVAAEAPGSILPPSVVFPRSVTFSDRVAQVGCAQLIGKHGFETQVTNRISATFSGQMVSRNGLGGGNLVGTIKTHWSPRLFTDVTLSFLRPQIITTKGQYTVDAKSFFSWQATLQTLLLPPTFNVTYGQRLSSKSTLTGFTSVRSGTYNIFGWGKDIESRGVMIRREPAAVSVGLTKQIDEGRGWTTQTSISPVDQSISVDYAIKVLGGVKVRTGFNIGTGSGISAFTSAERRLTENVRLSLGLNCAFPVGGVTLRVKLNRLGQKVLLPITLSREFRSDLVALCSVVPAVTYTALHYGYFEPRKQKRLKNRMGELRKQNKELILERRQAAKEALEVLRDQAVKKAQGELRKGGVVILEAWYGRKDSFPPSRFLPSSSTFRRGNVEEEASKIWAEERANLSSSNTTGAEREIDNDNMDLTTELYWDVKVPLQALVNKGQIIVPGSRSKANLLGFHDPVMGEKKHLLVVYSFRTQVHTVTVEDWSELAIPMRIHQI
ncbi:uncharacterized protein MEPE_02455 [Melanopsichium pennsylvanicum]|uniref:J domain-containing protein n=2 Tax=Melanopsichium pennsylvanicum TaxID=63383 RepID=A0AAJ4XKF7_9BASI|nr:molecular chaperone [Melanopsichium pennsylvanicum 4]SNX83748.1 uncharacterized protein MEPE_02455 [Melanopsichium pennsylvanicum]